MQPPEQVSPEPMITEVAIAASTRSDLAAGAVAESERAAASVSCTLCGTVAVGPPITWMFEIDARRGPVWACDRCARENLRSVEAKLDQEWW